MKRFFALFLALVMLSSAITACKDSATPDDTAAIETDAPAAAETDAPAPGFPTDRITENGAAMAHIVIGENADSIERLAAEELTYHIKTVSGADISTVNVPTESNLAIRICTPESYPELETLFPEDLAWLRETGEVGGTERYGDDGFAIRGKGGCLYIFGANSRGALNGVYDFIEENLGVLWIRSYDDEGLIYHEMPTITIEAADYREKSPFSVRGWVAGGFWGENVDQHNLFISRNKLNASYENVNSAFQWQQVSERGMRPFITCHNVKTLVINSPSYDPNNREYWDTNHAGAHLTYENSGQVNFWSDLTADTVADCVLASLDTYTPTVDIDCFGVNIEDFSSGNVYPENTLPFEYAPGEFVQPSDDDYLSTVFYTFLNKVARKVGAKYPDVTITTFAYTFAQTPPRCDLEPNVGLVFCPIAEELPFSLYDDQIEANAKIYSDLETWKQKTRNIVFYNYYGTFVSSARYERPIWDRLQEHFRYYAENGFTGVMSEGIVDYDQTHIWDTGVGHSPLTEVERPIENSTFLCSDTWRMNTLTFWLYHKLSWNPEEDIDALITEFCDKVYGDASEAMQDYYRILEEAWEVGRESVYDAFNVPMKWNMDLTSYTDYLFFCMYSDTDRDFGAEAVDALNRAWEAANDIEKERIRYIKASIELLVDTYNNG